MTGALAVRLFGRHAGVIAIDGDARIPEDWRFRYDDAYLASATPVPLSVMLPLQREAFAGARVGNWFGNLLPEGTVRETIETRLRLPPRDDFKLLEAIGGECAGAVSIGPDTDRAAGAPEEETDLETLLYLQGADAGEGAWAALGTPHRLSLAGAQDKIAVIRDADGRLRLPARGEASTHILKPDSLRIRGLRDLEVLGLRLARAVGLNVATAEPLRVAGRNALLIERYDRVHHADGRTQRLHQEDFCQALGYPAGLKYEASGGPGLDQCSELIRHRLRLGPEALQRFLDWVVFCALIGNADAHAKNLSLLCGDDGKRRIAPFYDLVPTLALPHSMIEREPALRIGAATAIDAISRDDWREFATQTGYAPGFVLARCATLATALQATASAVVSTLIAEGVDQARLEAATAVVRENARRMATVVGG